MDYPFHPEAERYPLMTDTELDALAEDIRVNRQRLPVLLFRGQVIDGRNRILACRRAAIIPWAEVWEGTEAELPAAVASLNEHRRHLTPEKLREVREARIKIVAEKRREGKSTRAIAEEVGVSAKQVRDDLAEATGKGYPVDPPESKVKSKDGKKRPAKKPAKPKPEPTPAPQPADPEEAEEAATPPGKDAVGLDVPEHLADQFAANVKFAELLRHIARAAKIIDELAQLPGGQFLRKAAQPKATGKTIHFRLSALQDARRAIRFARPHAQCPYCFHEHPESVAPECRACLGTGVVAEMTWKNAPEDYRAAVLLAGAGTEAGE